MVPPVTHRSNSGFHFIRDIVAGIPKLSRTRLLDLQDLLLQIR